MAGMNHVGLTVGDIDAAVRWYADVFDLELLEGPMHCDTTTPGAERRTDVFGAQWRAMKLAHMVTENGAGVELFQFVDPAVETNDDNFPYWKVGPNHIALTVTDLERTLKRLTLLDGKQRSAVFDVQVGARICYCEDPWGNVVELVSAAYRDLSAATAV